MHASIDDVVDRGYSQRWVRKIAKDLASEILAAGSAEAAAPEIRRFFGEKGARELRDMMLREVAGKSGPEALRAMAHAMRQFALNRPALTAATLQNIGEDGAARPMPAASELNAVALKILALHKVTGESARHALRMLKSLVRGFTLHEMTASYRESLDYERSFEFAVDVFIEGIPALISGHELSNAP